MPTPLSPSSSQEIIPISPPPSSHLKAKGKAAPTPTASSSKSITTFTTDLKENSKSRSGSGSKTASATVWKSKDVEDQIKRKVTDDQRSELSKKSRSQVTQRMLSTRGKDLNPITNSDLYSRTDHFVSCSTGHQQSNRGGGSEGSWTYWQVRSAQMNDQARPKKTDIFKGCVVYLNGSTGPKVSNLQVQHLISSNGGRLASVPTQSSSCTHIIANGGLSGTKTQKHIDGQGTRGASRRAKVVKVEWILDSVEKGQKLSEAGYGMVEDPSQPNLFKTLGVKPKLESEVTQK